MTLDHLAQQMSRERQLKEQANEALAKKQITRSEYNYFLQEELGITPTNKKQRAPLHKRRKHVAMKTAATLLFMIIIASALFLIPHNKTPLTGFITYQPEEEIALNGNTYNENTNQTINLTGSNTLKASGTLTNGNATITLTTKNESLLIWKGTTTTPHYNINTDKKSYAQNETINITVQPRGASYTLWQTNETGDKSLVTEPYLTTNPGNYRLDALINNSNNITKVTTTFLIRNDTNNSKDILREEEIPTTTFTNACNETCTITNTTNATLNIEVSNGATLTINNLTITQPRKNNAPTLTNNINNITLIIGENKSINLNEHFTDPDGDKLTYDTMNTPDVTMTLNNNTLTITSNKTGKKKSIIYASDLYSITQSNQFTITVTAVNTSVNETAPPSNESGPTTPSNKSGSLPPASNTSLDCSATDPNELPVACLLKQAGDYFPEDEILLENLDRKPVARFTAIGNLLLKGRIIENSNSAPSSRDFRIGYVDRDGNSQATIWIETGTGDLHLKGHLYEENANLNPTSGSYSLINKRSIYLAYANQEEGDLYLRGNAIPYRFTEVS